MIKEKYKEKYIDVKPVFSVVEKNLDLLREIIADLQIDYLQAEKTRLKENPKIVKRVLRYRGCGYSKQEALNKTAEDFNCTVQRVRIVYQENQQNTAYIRLYARKYLVQKLHDFGFAPVQIAKIAGISRQSVFRLLKSDCIVTD